MPQLLKRQFYPSYRNTSAERTGMSNRDKVFGGNLVLGSASYALAGLRAACSLYNPSDTEQAWRTVLALDQLPSVADKRVWGHFARADGSDSFISTGPGEYRTVRPDSDEDLVVELSHTDSEADSRRSSSSDSTLLPASFFRPDRDRSSPRNRRKLYDESPSCPEGRRTV